MGKEGVIEEKKRKEKKRREEKRREEKRKEKKRKEKKKTDRKKKFMSTQTLTSLFSSPQNRMSDN